ncbi:MAG: MarR family transcriptional regulator [Microbacteriaceae bacterium]|nr:MarR family transcriptional regulator [Microbacteriaceae bacterium]
MRHEPDPAAFDLTNELRLVVFRLARRMRAERVLDELSDSQFAVITFLHLYGPHTLGAIAMRERVSAPAMTRTVNRLERSGLVERLPDPDDGRHVLVRLAEGGRRVVTATEEKRNAWLDSQLTGLGEQDREALARAIALMREIVSR